MGDVTATNSLIGANQKAFENLLRGPESVHLIGCAGQTADRGSPDPPGGFNRDVTSGTSLPEG